MSIATVTSLRFFPGRSDRPALDGIDLDVAPGEVVLVDGPSGGGKSTLLRALGGLVPHFHGGRFSGCVNVAGVDTRSAGPARLAGVVGSLFQDPEAQSVRATVARDVAFGPENLGMPADRIPQRVRACLEMVGALHLHDRHVATLSGGERQRVALAGVLATGPRLLLLDEPTSQLDDAGVAHLESVVHTLAAAGTAVVIAEHHASRFAGVAGRALHLRGGRLAEPAGAPLPGDPPPAPPGDEVCRLEGVAAGYGGRRVLADCDLSLRAGSITALHGPNGAGKSTLARVIAGLVPVEAGRVVVEGRDVTAVPAERRHPAVGMLMQDAGRWLLHETVAREVAGEARRDRTERVDPLLERLDLTHLAESHPLDLSVGERERVAIAAVLADRPRVLVLDEPSRGMDPSRRDALTRELRRRARDGAAVLVVTHDPCFARATADRHVELVEGRVLERAVPVAA